MMRFKLFLFRVATLFIFILNNNCNNSISPQSLVEIKSNIQSSPSLLNIMVHVILLIHELYWTFICYGCVVEDRSGLYNRSKMRMPVYEPVECDGNLMILL